MRKCFDMAQISPTSWVKNALIVFFISESVIKILYINRNLPIVLCDRLPYIDVFLGYPFYVLLL